MCIRRVTSLQNITLTFRTSGVIFKLVLTTFSVQERQVQSLSLFQDQTITSSCQILVTLSVFFYVKPTEGFTRNTHISFL